MILNTGLRTDIPAFYTPWFLNRLKEGFVLVRSPYAPSRVTRYRISPDVVDVLGFCTKNPAPMLPHLELLRPYGQHWYVTITPYGRDVEPNVPPAEQVIQDFRRLSEIVGMRSIGWRYDPILISETYPVERHIADFERMARTLSGSTEVCVISFIDLYDKVRRNFPEARAVGREDRFRLGRAFVEIGRRYGIAIKSCAEGDELAPCGVDTSGCMTISVYEIAIGAKLSVPKGKPSRPECLCHLSADIGAYNTCGHLCRYCYANHDEATVRRNFAAHDPASPFLLGGFRPGDEVGDAKQESWLERQMSMLD